MMEAIKSSISRYLVILILAVSVVAATAPSNTAHANFFSDIYNAVTGGGSSTTSGGSASTTSTSTTSTSGSSSSSSSGGFWSDLASGIGTAVGTVANSFFGAASTGASSASNTVGGALSNLFGTNSTGSNGLLSSLTDPNTILSAGLGLITGVYNIPVDFDGDGVNDGGFIYDENTDNFSLEVPDGSGGSVTVGSINDALQLGIDFGTFGGIMANGNGAILQFGPFSFEIGDFFSGLFGGAGGFCGQTALGGAGTVLCNAVSAFGGVPQILSMFAYISAMVMTLFGCLKLVEHANDPRSVSLWEPAKRFIVGGALFALPYTTNVIANLTGMGIGGLSNTGMAGNISGGGLDAMLVRLMSDIWSPMLFAISSFAYIAAFVLTLVGIHRLLRTAQDGPRGPAGIGTIMTFVVAGALFSADAMLNAFSGSLFGNITGGGAIHTFGVLAQSTGDAAVDDHVAATIGVAVAFMVIVGWISFIRGFFIIRGVAEGDQQASLMAGVTHLLGGALAVNIGTVIEAVQSTLGLSAFGLSFN